MGLLRRFERTLERAFEEPFARVFKGRVHPLEIARRVLREMDEAKVLGLNETLAPSRFLVRLSPEDHGHLEGMLETMGREMESVVIDYANRREYHFAARPRIMFARDESLSTGEFRVEASFEERGAPERDQGLPPAVSARPEEVTGSLRIISGEYAGSVVLLREPRLRIGRAEDNDLVLPDPRVSRFHAEIVKGPEGHVLRDLGSTNGTLVGGRRIRERLLEEGDVITIGGVKMRFTLNGG